MNMFKIKDRVKESSITEGNGSSIVLNDTFGGFASFANAVGSGNSTFYTIENNADYEIGIGTYNPVDNSISRDLILESTNNNQRVNLLGVSVVFGTYPATHSFFVNDQGFASGQAPYYSGIAFPDGRVQNVAYQGGGQPGHIAFFTDQYNFDSNHYLTWNDATSTLNVSGVAKFYSDVSVSGNFEVFGTQTIVNTQIDNSAIDLTTLTNTTFRINDAAGCFFHAYVDNDDDNTVALYSTNEPSPTWRLGLKDFSPSFTSPPIRGYVYGDEDSIGGVADNKDDSLYVLNATNGFWIRHVGRDILNIQRNAGLNFYNDSPVVVPLTSRGASAQAANLQEWKSYAGSTLASVSKDGQISIPSIKFPDGSVQTSAGVGVSLSGIIGAGTANFIPKFSDTDTITDSVISESGGRIGINTTSPGGLLHTKAPDNESNLFIQEGSRAIGSAQFLQKTDGYVSAGGLISYASGYVAGSLANVGAGGAALTNMGEYPLAIAPLYTSQPLLFGAGNSEYMRSQNGNLMIGRQASHEFAGYNTLSIDGTTGSFIDLYATSTAKLRIQGNSSDGTIQTLESIPLRFKTNQVERMTIDEQGRVGIGTTSSSQKLDVAGGIKSSFLLTNNVIFGSTNSIAGASNDLTISSTLDNIVLSTFNGTFGDHIHCTNTFYATRPAVNINPEAGNIDFSVFHNTSTSVPLFHCDADLERVGIGTDSPDRLLHVNGSAKLANIQISDGNISSPNSDLQITAGGSQDSRNHVLLENTGGITLNGSLLSYATNKNIKLDLRDNGGVIILDGGNVGIGTSAPAYTLDVNGSGQFVHPPTGCGLTVANASGHGLQFGECAYGSYGSSYNGDLYTGVTHTKLDASQEYMLLSKGDHTFISAKDGYSSIIRGGNNNQTYQLLVNNFMFSVGQYSEKMKFSTSKVEFNRNSGNLDFAIHGSTFDNLFYADASQNTIGINTDTPTSRLLTIRGKSSPDNNAAVLLQGSGVGTTTTDGFLLSQAHDGTSYVWNFENKPLVCATNNLERIRIDENGKVGIGTANPAPAGGDTSIHIAATNYPELKLTNDTTGHGANSGTAIQVVNNSFVVTNRQNNGSITFNAFDSVGVSKQRWNLSPGGSIFNEDGENVDFRVEGNSDPNLLFLDASTDRVGIGTESPLVKLHVHATTSEGTVLSQTDDSTSWAGLLVRDSDNINVGSLQFGNSGVLDQYPDGTVAYPHLRRTFFFGSRTSGVPFEIYQGRDTNGDGSAALPFRLNNRRIVLDTHGNTILTAASGQQIFASGQSVMIPTASPSGATLKMGRHPYQASIRALGGEESNNQWMIVDSSGNPAALNYFTNDNVLLAYGGGNVGVGTSSPGSHKFRVKGGSTAFDGGNVIINDDGGNYDFRIEGDADVNLFKTNASTDNVSIGAAPEFDYVKFLVYSYDKQYQQIIGGGCSGVGLLNNSYINSGVKTATSFYSYMYPHSTTDTLTSLIHFRAGRPVTASTGPVTTERGFYADVSGATHNNWGFQGIVPSGDSNYNLYMSSTAANYLRGNLGIGAEDAGLNATHRAPLSISPADYAITSTPTAEQQTNKIRVYDRQGNGTAGFGISTSSFNIATSGLIAQRFWTNATERMKIHDDGKLEHYGTEAKIADGSAYELDISNSAATLGGNRLQLKSTETVFNEAGANYDFRIEGDTNPYLLHVDAAMDNVSIGKYSSYPNFALTVYRNTDLDDVGHLNSARGIYSDIDHHTSTPGNIHKYSIGNSVDIRQHLGSGVVNSGYVMGVDANGLMTGSGYLHQAYGLRTYAGGHTNFPTAGRIKNSYGVYNRVLNLGSGTMENAYGEYITISAGSNGTIGNAYGIYIVDNAGTIASGDYGIYQQGVSACNYFAGSIGIGTSSPSGKLHIQDGTLHIHNDGSVPQFELVDTDTDNTLRLNSTNSVFAFNLDPDQKIAGSELRFNVDNSDKFILKHNINEFKQSTQVEASNNLVQFGNSITIINGNEENIDLQVKGDSDPYLLYCDASTDRVGIGTDSPTQKLDIDSSGIRIRDDKTPASASATGSKGEIVWDSNYVYVCVATNTWKRASLSTW